MRKRESALERRTRLGFSTILCARKGVAEGRYRCRYWMCIRANRCGLVWDSQGRVLIRGATGETEGEQ